MKPMDARMPMTEATRLSEPMIRVPVFKEAHEQQFGSFGRATIFQKKLSESLRIDQGARLQRGAGATVRKFWQGNHLSKNLISEKLTY